jgi:hypothetical protein
MRFISIALVCLIISINSLAQNIEPNPMKLTWGLVDTPRMFIPDSFQQKSMMLGYQWSGSSRVMGNYLLCNTMANHGYHPGSPRIYPLNFVNQPTWLDKYDCNVGAWFAPFMQYEPSLELTESNIGTLIKPGDPSNPVCQ